MPWRRVLGSCSWNRKARNERSCNIQMLKSVRSDNPKSKTCPERSRRIQNLKFAVLLCAILLAPWPSANAQQQKVQRIGVLSPGGPWYEAIDGLRGGLKEMGLEEGKQFTLVIRDMKGNPKEAEEAAKNFEQEKVNVIYALGTSAITAATGKRVTS